MRLQNHTQLGEIGFRDGLHRHAVAIYTIGEHAVWVPDECLAATHTRAKIQAGLAQHHHHTAGHVLTTMVATPFHHSNGAGIAHSKPLASPSSHKELALTRAVQTRVTDQNIIFTCATRANGHPPTSEALRHPVLGLTL